MQLFVTADQLVIEPTLWQRIERRLRLAAGGFEPHVQQVTIHLRDANECNGGVYTLCTVAAEFRNGDHISVSQAHPNVMTAISGALQRLRHALAFRLERGWRRPQAEAPAGITEYWIG